MPVSEATRVRVPPMFEPTLVVAALENNRAGSMCCAC